jgi:hypothetical protein
MFVLRPQAEAPEVQDPPLTSSTATTIIMTEPTATAPSSLPADTTPLSDSTSPPRWLSDAVSELGNLAGPKEWISVVAGLLALDRLLGFPTGKVRGIIVILFSA